MPNKRTFTPDAIGDYVFTLTVRDPGELTHSANVTIHACPANETSDWFDTGETRCHNNALQKRQTRRLSNGVTKFQWVADPDNEEWGAWQDTSASHRNEEPGDWINRGGPSGFYNVSFQSQRRTVAYEKQQRRTSACGNTEERWIAASRRESRTKLAGRTLSRPRTPIDSQWEVRRMNNQIQVKVTSLPTVTSSIIEVRARLEGGSTSDRAKVIKPIGTTLNTWVTVLSSSDDRWREGAWVAKIRFGNSEKNSNYSATKPVTAPTTPTPPVTPPITPPAPPVVLPPLPPPTNVSATATARSVTVSWSAVSDATGYVVEIGIPPSAGGLGPTSDTTTGTSITIGNLLPWTTYEYRVKATAEGRIGTWSGWATVVTSAPPPPPPVTPLPAPTNVMAEPTHNSVRVSWRVVGGATGYVVEIGIPPSAGGLGHTSDPTTGTSITIGNLLPWTTYEYRVKATAEGRIGT